MMGSVVYAMKVGSLLPSLRVALTDPPEGPGAPAPPADLTTATGVMFRLRLVGADTPLINRAAVIEDADDGIVRFDWGSGDTDEAGVYEGEFVVTCPVAKPMAYPSDQNFLLRFVEGV